MQQPTAYDRIALVLACAMFLVFGPGRSEAAPLVLSGEITTAGSTFTTAQLQALGSTNVNVGTDSYAGVSLWTLLGGAPNALGPGAGNSNVVPNLVPGGNTNNPVLRSYVVAGSANEERLISLGEINLSFGGAPMIVAHTLNGTLLSTPQLVVQDDPTGARNIVDLTSLRVRSVPAQPNAARVTTDHFDLTGVVTPASYDLAALQAFPATTVSTGFFQGTTPQGPFVFTGVNLWTLLTAAGIPSGYDAMLATGSDGFQVLYSLDELNPAHHPGSDVPDLIAYAVDGGSLGSNGFARIVKPGDTKGGRYVSNLASLQLVNLVNVPATILLLIIGLAGMLPLVFGVRKSQAAS